MVKPKSRTDRTFPHRLNLHGRRADLQFDTPGACHRKFWENHAGPYTAGEVLFRQRCAWWLAGWTPRGIPCREMAVVWASMLLQLAYINDDGAQNYFSFAYASTLHNASSLRISHFQPLALSTR